MANTRHPKCAIRSMAVEAKKRLQSKAYGTGEIPAPAGISPTQRRIYIRLRELRESGEEVVNPIQQLADKEFMKGLSHEERQRYIIQLAADYLAVKKELDDRSAAERRPSFRAG